MGSDVDAYVRYLSLAYKIADYIPCFNNIMANSSLSTGEAAQVDCIKFWPLHFKYDVDKLKSAQTKLPGCSQSSWYHLGGETKKAGFV